MWLTTSLAVLRVSLNQIDVAEVFIDVVKVSQRYALEVFSPAIQCQNTNYS